MRYLLVIERESERELTEFELRLLSKPLLVEEIQRAIDSGKRVKRVKI